MITGHPLADITPLPPIVNARQAREVAQDLIIDKGVHIVTEFLTEILEAHLLREPTDAEVALVSQQVRVQGNRVRRLFGYEAE